MSGIAVNFDKYKGSPHFYCGEREAFCPALDITRDLEGGLVMQRNGRDLDQFLATCFQS